MAASLALLATAACTSINATADSFAGTRWQMVAVDGQPVPALPLTFTDNWLSASLGCNRLDASFSVERGWLVPGIARVTERGCLEPNIMAREERIEAILLRPMRLQWRSARQLTLRNDRGSIGLQRR